MSEPTWHLATLPTPFHFRMAELSRTNMWTQRLGWTLADVYDTVEAEHAALRNGCAFSDRTALATYSITGRDAAAYLDRLAGGCGGEVSIGRSRRVVLSDDVGGLIADGVVMRPCEQEWLLTLPVRSFDWLLVSAMGFDCTVADVSETIATLAVEGPTSCAALLSAGFGGLQALRPGGVTVMKVGRTPVTVARISCTGGLGYEMRVGADNALWLLDRIRREAVLFRPVPVGQKALALARLEAGHAAAGSDYESTLTAPQSLRRTPLELGMGSLIDWDNGTFTGKAALERQRQRGAASALVGLEIAGAEVPEVHTIHLARRIVGHMNSVAWSPTCKRVIALADISADVLGGDDDLYIVSRSGQPRAAKIVQRPFFRCANACRTPPDAQ